MRRISEINALYNEIDSFLEGVRIQALRASDHIRVRAIRAKQIINDQAYFVLCWGQLESEINDACRSAIRKRVSTGNWTSRRAWDLYDPDDPRLSGLRFEDRVALILDRQAGPDSAWARVMHYYNVRNQIAHGTLRPDRIDASNAVGEFFMIQGKLQA